MSKTDFLKSFMEEIWNQKKLDHIADYVHPNYKIHIDTGDPWEGKLLSHELFLQRLHHSFVPFPDIHFEILSAIEEQYHVAITWQMTGTNLGAIGTLPATGKSIKTPGMTIYHFEDGLIAGHSQVFNRGLVQQQLGF